MKLFWTKFVGVANLIFCGMGIALSILEVLHKSLLPTNTQGHGVATYVMFACSLTLIGALGFTGIALLVDATRWKWALTVCCSEIVYFVASTSFGDTGAAFAVGNIGLYPQLITAYPIFALLILAFASKASKLRTLQ